MSRLRVGAFLVVCVLLAALPLYAQLQSVAARTTVNVPFDFVVGDTTLPAGEYAVESVNETTLKLTGPTASVFVQVNAKITSSEVPETKLVFTEQGGKHVLHQVWTEGHPHAHNIVHTSATLDIP